MGGGYGHGLDFGATWGSGKLSLSGMEPETIPGDSFQIGRSLGAKALNYDVKNPKTGKSYRFFGGSTIRNVDIFASKGVRKKLNPKVAKGLSEQIGGRPRDWKHLKGIGTFDYKCHAKDAEVHRLKAAGQPKVKFKIKEWL